MDQLHLSPTTISQYIRLENCERYLRFQLVPEDLKPLTLYLSRGTVRLFNRSLESRTRF